MKWKFCVVLALLFLASLPLFSESVEIPNLEPEEEYVMMGQDIMDLYQTIKDLDETKTEYQNLADEMMKTLEGAETYLNEYEEENEKLVLENSFLIGTTVFSIGVSVSGLIIWLCTK